MCNMLIEPSTCQLETNLRYQYFKQWKLNEQTLKKERRQCSSATNVDELSLNGWRARIEHITGRESQDSRTVGDCINEEAHTTGKWLMEIRIKWVHRQLLRIE